MLYMFRAILVHYQEQLLQAVHRIWYMPVYTKCDVQLIKVAPDDGLT